MATFPLQSVNMEKNSAQSLELFQIAFERYLTATKQREETPEIKAALLYDHAGKDLQKAVVGWTFDEETMSDYKKLKDAVTAKLKPDINPFYASLIFNLATRQLATPGSTPALVNWKIVHEKMPWGLVLLIGGGMAMADASEESHLSHVVGQELVLLKDYLPPYLIMVVLCIATIIVTEVSSSTAIANIVLPVLAEMAIGMKIHPLYFMLPATLCCSYCFMLPVATPPNAIVLAASNMTTKDMMIPGVVMNLLSMFILLILFPTVGVALYDCYSFPKGAENINLLYSSPHTS